ncbi:MAG: hypothetical protein J0L81_17175 [Caulobacterales bacterium]|jgi:photosystem II stability/assembly factor-like uncharacterized protein|nr:hypothetical protein [Caulobacterales bacterium]
MASTLLIGSANTRIGATGTLYRSQDGKRFEPTKGLPIDTGVQAIAAHPTQAGLVYAATKSGVFRSSDAGASWSRVLAPTTTGEEFWSVAFDPSRPHLVTVGASPLRVHRSEDGGETWTRSDALPEVCDMSVGKMFKHSRLMGLTFDPNNPRLAFGACETAGFVVSEDGGVHWENRSQALLEIVRSTPSYRNQINVPDDNEGILDGHAVCVSKNHPGLVFYACRVGLFSTRDLGRTWRDHEIARFAPISYARDIRVDPMDGDCLYLALSISSRSEAGALYRSTDAGETWRRADESVTARSTIMGMGAHPRDAGKVVYVTRGGQVHWSEDGCATWQAAQLPPESGDAYVAAIL